MGARGPRVARSGTPGLGQHFLSRTAAAEFVRGAALSTGDLVVEVGAGAGVITRELMSACGDVVAIELDPRLAARLRRRFVRAHHVHVVEADVLNWSFPSSPFRAVGNLPFAATTAVLRRLLSDPASALTRADLIVQLEVAVKRTRVPPANALSLSWAPWWQTELGLRIPAGRFHPIPSVDAAILIVRRRATPLLPLAERTRFDRFVGSLFLHADRPIPQALRASLEPARARRLASDIGLAHRTRPVDLEAETAVTLFRRWRDAGGRA